MQIRSSRPLTDRRMFMIGTTLGLVRMSIPRWVNAETTLSRSLRIDKRYLNIPVKIGAPCQHISIRLSNEIIREIFVELAPFHPDYWVFMDLTQFKGRTLTLTLNHLAGAHQNLERLRQADDIIGHQSIYHEALRPQFHYSPKRGWMNDPNGLVYYDGEYHMFFQHCPYQAVPTSESLIHWGHGVSKDLIHWQELPEALYPEKGSSIWSGSAVVDENNTAGFQDGTEKTLVALFTLANPAGMVTDRGRPFAQGLAYSNDRGRTWIHYADNPVLPNVSAFNRDPKVIWYTPQKKWVMALFLDRADYAGHPELSPDKAMDLSRDKSSYGFFASRDLKHWEKLSEVHIDGEAECPEFYEIAVDGDPNNTRWIIAGASGFYIIGTFDGTTFTPESGPHRLHEGNGWYASQTFNHIPAGDGRRILIPWAQTPGDPTDEKQSVYKNMPFNQSMGIPVELTLHTNSEGLRLYANPVRELSALRAHCTIFESLTLQPQSNPLASLHGELLEIIVVIDLKDANQITFDLRGIPLVYDVTARQLTCADTKAILRTENGVLRLRILIDRTLIEIFGNDGQLYQSASVTALASNTSLSLSSDKQARIIALEVHTLKSIWT
jgi:fructan beta-fructosidase